MVSPKILLAVGALIVIVAAGAVIYKSSSGGGSSSSTAGSGARAPISAPKIIAAAAPIAKAISEANSPKSNPAHTTSSDESSPSFKFILDEDSSDESSLFSQLAGGLAYLGETVTDSDATPDVIESVIDSLQFKEEEGKLTATVKSSGASLDPFKRLFEDSPFVNSGGWNYCDCPNVAKPPAAAVPEPDNYALIGLGLVLLIFIARNNSK